MTHPPSQTEQDLAASLRISAADRQQLADQLDRVRNRVQQDLNEYLEKCRQQHQEAAHLLAENPPDYSRAATACHRALQYRRQAEALAWVQMELR